jgi:precorrin-2/cobalt-factor-2 C20-methyltransferase
MALAWGLGMLTLLSVRADRLVRNANIVAYFRKAGKKGQARRLADPLISADVGGNSNGISCDN